MSDYVELSFKNHKKYNKQIMFVIFKECHIDDRQKLDNLIQKYLQILKEKNNLTIIVDARNIKKFDKTLAFQKATELDKYKNIVKKNVISMAILLENPILKFLLDAVTKIHPFVVPTIVCKENKEAMDFAISHFK